jgi:hypothetical protein
VDCVSAGVGSERGSLREDLMRLTQSYDTDRNDRRNWKSRRESFP